MQRELELCHDAEVAAAAAQPPEEICVLGLARVDELPVGRHDVGADEVVAGEAVLAHQPADPAAERVAADAGRRHEPAGRRQPVGLRLVVDGGPGRAAADVRRRRAAGSTRTPVIGERSITSPPSHVENPAMLWPPPRIASFSWLLRAKPIAAATSAAPAQRDDHRRAARVVRAVPDLRRLLDSPRPAG